MSTMKKLVIAVQVVSGAILLMGSPALAGQNDFFGTSVPGGGSAQSPNPYADPSVPKGDFTQDEKRMQKKYAKSVAHAKKLIAKGKKMMARGSKHKKDKLYKKGKVFKEIGEKRLAELQANNPLSELVGSGKTASADTVGTR